MKRALSASPKSAAGFCERVLETGALNEPELLAVVAEQSGMPAVDLSRTAIALRKLELIPRPVAEADLLLPLSTEGDRLHVAVDATSYTQETLDELQFITGMLVSPYAALPATLDKAIAAAYDARERGDEVWHGEGLTRDAAPAIATVLPAESGARTDEVDGSTGEIEALSFEVADGEPAAADEEVVHKETMRVGPARILVVDDEPEILRMLEKSLKAEGYAVDTARDGREAEQKLKGTRPDLVLLDAMLPHVHGFELCNRIKGDARLRSVPVVMMSAVYRGWRFAQDAREAFGADDYVEKPFHLADVHRRVHERLQNPRAIPPEQKDAAERAYKEGVKHLSEGNPDKARPALEQAAKLDPFSARNHFALGRALREAKDAFRAMSEYEKAVELRPSHFAALCSLAELYLEKGFRRKSVEALERALICAPDLRTREGIRTRLLRLL
ncbi:MAG TPA: response regulator [Myxococcales bacterium]|nr:response regulator [Myxococcales bacterium]